MDAKRLIIFDCDGVLVDSEPIALSVLTETLGMSGIAIDEEGAAKRYLGRSLTTVRSLVREEYGLQIDDPFLTRMRDLLYARFSSELRPIHGIQTALDSLEAAGIAWCVASSSQIERIALCLSATGMLDRFSPHIFSASMVTHGKPAPDLFLFAANKMGVEPSECLVVEDSPAGILAARAAGMDVLAFTGGSHTGLLAYRDGLAALMPVQAFDAMENLLHLVAPARRPKDQPDA
ncbi:HAD family hydrolase [Rhizobium sp. SL42]|uniref:HAD family hydrolase n=1 Tax=Rhizobium sp. SL42 TaxID=2806346 RepID=UPI001F26EBFF|nr:HAD family hydrolase [Rhizobium sp. SL42]UJW75517.1 HAD family hydrolase [Rhizobium sp. SL42]